MTPESPWDSRRQPWIAAVLSLLCTGLGQLYCGRTSAGLTLFLLSLLFLPVTALAAMLPPATWILWGIILCQLCMATVYVYAAINAYRLARRIGAAYTPREYNRGALYTLFILVGIVYPAASIWVVRNSLFEAFYIPSRSMAPSILLGDRVLVNKLAARRGSPARGEVIVFRSPGNRSQRFVKRVIGLPGDTVAVRHGRAYVNGRNLARETRGAARRATTAGLPGGQVLLERTNDGRRDALTAQDSTGNEDYPATQVPPDHVFVLGDNRSHSRDSRQFGPVPIGDIVGPVEYVYWPSGTWRRFGRFHHVAADPEAVGSIPASSPIIASSSARRSLQIK